MAIMKTIIIASAAVLFAGSALAAEREVTFSATGSTRLEAEEQARKNAFSRYQGTQFMVTSVRLIGCEETGSSAYFDSWKCVVAASVAEK